MKVVIHFSCNIAKNSEHKIILNIDDKLIKDFGIIEDDELTDFIVQEISMCYEFKSLECSKKER